MKNFPYTSSVTAYDLQCVWTDVQKNYQRLQSECFCFWRIMFLSIWSPPLLVPLPHFLTLVFSSSPFSRLPRSPEFAAGQKAAAEAQPIWNAAPPFWRSEGEEGTRLVVNQDAKIHKLFMHNQHAQPVSYYHAGSEAEHQMQKSCREPVTGEDHSC